MADNYLDKLRQEIIKCPKCSADIEVTEGYIQWCEHCLWNLKPYEEQTEKDNIINRIYKSMGRRFSKQLYHSMLKRNSVKPTITIAKILAITLSCIVLIVPIICIAIAAYLIASAGLTVVSVLLSLFLIGMAIAALPSRTKMPKDILKRSEFPALYGLLDKITESSKTEAVYGIVISKEFNAAYTEVGLKQRKIVYIGLPLFYILKPEERVALLSHEIAHGLNGDISRGFITSTALHTLITWHEIISPDFNEGDDGVMSILSRFVMSAFSRIILLVIYILIHLVYNDSQRAEYLADYMGAHISGKVAMNSLLYKLHLGSTYRIALQKSALSRGEISFFNELDKQLKQIPKKELERIRLVEEMEESRLDATHPPTAYRIEFVRKSDRYIPKVSQNEAETLIIDKELNRLKESIEDKLIDEYKESIY
jgi:Zn-dependent protease with chaperone function